MLVNYIREHHLAHGVAKADSYSITMYILASMLVLGFVCNALIRPVAQKYFMTDSELAEERRLAHDRDVHVETGTGAIAVNNAATNPALVLGAWLAVGIPPRMGISMTLQKALILFK